MIYTKPTPILAAAAASLFLSFPLHAAVVITEVNSPGAGAPAETLYAPDVSATDLLQGLAAVESGAPWQTVGSAARLNNGVHGPSFNDDNPGSLAEIAWANPGSVVTFDLGTGANGLGYDISSVLSFAAWNGAGFGNQGYTLEFKPLGGVFATVATVDYNPLGGGAGATKVTITDDGGLLATGIEEVRFTHNSVPGAVAGRITYRELDVIGTATIPEPSATVLLGLSALACLRRRRRTA